jgi:hypothetical protein
LRKLEQRRGEERRGQGVTWVDGEEGKDVDEKGKFFTGYFFGGKGRTTKAKVSLAALRGTKANLQTLWLFAGNPARHSTHRHQKGLASYR